MSDPSSLPPAPVDLDRLRAHIRTLVELDEADASIASCYVSLGDRWNQVLGRRAAAIRLALPIDARPAFDAALEPIRRFVAAPHRDDTRALVAFSRGGASPFFLGIQLAVAVEEQLTYDSAPSIWGLVQLKDTYHRYLVMLLTAEYARILEVSLGQVTLDLWAARPALQSRARASWARTHYHHRRARPSEAFLAEKVALLDRMVTRGGHTHILLAGRPPQVERFRAALPPRLAAMLFEPAEDLDRADPDRVVAATLAAFVAQEERESMDAVGRLLGELRRGGLAVSGHDGCLRALELGQVDQLVIAQGFEGPPGWRCGTCGAVVAAPTRPAGCARCGDAALAPASLRDELVRLAERHEATIELVARSEALAELGGVGALLRYADAWRPAPW